MNKPYLFLVLVGFLCLPLTTNALYIPSEPFGSRNNPIYFQESRPTDQIIRESQQNVWGAQQRADDTLGGILRDAVRNQQLLQYTPPPQPVIYAPMPASPPVSDFVIPSIPDACPPRAIPVFGEGTCICRWGDEWNTNRTACVHVPTPNERLANGDGYHGTSASQQLPPTPVKENWRQKLIQWVVSLL
jgi:hypothetical protein